jgi:hypothetical protein
MVFPVPGEERDLLLSLGDRKRRRCERHLSTSWSVVKRTTDFPYYITGERDTAAFVV